jgi:hypothetical protein
MNIIADADKFAPFDDEAAQSMGRAFDEAWLSLQQTHARPANPPEAERARAALAQRIIELAQEGERDPARLRDRALAAMAAL